MPPSEAQKRATAKYVREKVRSLSIRFYPADYELLDWIKEQPNQQGYIRDLVRADMAKRKS